MARPLSPLADPGRPAIDIARDVLAEVLPIHEGLVSLECAGDPRGPEAAKLVFEGRKGWTLVVLRLFVWDQPEGAPPTIRDIKEQEVALLPAAADPARVDPYLRGWAAAVHAVLRAAPLERVASAMPHELCDARVLGLKRARSAADFEAALLMPSRLGKLLQPPR